MGKRRVWTTTHDAASRWDTYGLLTEGLEREKAAHVAERLGSQWDEED